MVEVEVIFGFEDDDDDDGGDTGVDVGVRNDNAVVVDVDNDLDDMTAWKQ